MRNVRNTPYRSPEWRSLDALIGHGDRASLAYDKVYIRTTELVHRGVLTEREADRILNKLSAAEAKWRELQEAIASVQEKWR